MTIKYEAAYLSLLMALGLACTDRPSPSEGGTSDGTGTSDSSSDSMSTHNGDGDGDSTTDPSTGDGDGDSTTTDPSTGDGDGDSTTGAPPDPYSCDNPVVIMQAGTETPSGFVECDDGFIHRAEAVECVMPQAAGDAECEMDMFGCTGAADCVEQPYGSCHFDNFFGQCDCHYGCVTDADCGEGMACVCAGVFSARAQCVPMDCATDTDCGDQLCGLSRYEGICDTSHSLVCTTDQDECHSDDECDVAPCDPMFPDAGEAPYHCTGSVGPGYTCEAPGWCNGDCGRPFFVDGVTRTASASSRRDWCASPTKVAPSISHLSPETRIQLSAYWTAVGLFEHASVASFARAAMELLSLGAPPSLLLATRAATADEIEHARLAFALASAYAGAPVGPGSVAMTAALEHGNDPEAILAGLIDEACVGETLAALEAQHAAQLAEDPAVARVLARIAADELRHAQLGWRTLRWLLDAHPELRAFALVRLDAALLAARAAGDPDGPSPRDLDEGTDLRAHGVLDTQQRARLRVEIIDHVLAPCVARLRRARQLEARTSCHSTGSAQQRKPT